MRRDAADLYEFEPAPPTLTVQQEAMDALSEMYSLLKEEDLWAGLWLKKAKYQETNAAIAYEQQGFFEQAQGAYEVAMSKFRNDYNGQASPIGIQQVKPFRKPKAHIICPCNTYAPRNSPHLIAKPTQPSSAYA